MHHTHTSNENFGNSLKTCFDHEIIISLKMLFSKFKKEALVYCLFNLDERIEDLVYC